MKYFLSSIHYFLSVFFSTYLPTGKCILLVYSGVNKKKSPTKPIGRGLMPLNNFILSSFTNKFLFLTFYGFMQP